MAMFSSTRSQTANSSGNLVEFKAGRCKMESGSGPTKRKVIAEKEKGLVYVKQSSDQLVHFCWKNRDTGGVVDDLIIFPGDTEFKEVKGCPDGQVFMLKFQNSGDPRLFWSQDAALDKDIVQKVNDALNKPPAPQRMAARGGPSDRVSTTESSSFPADAVDQDLRENMNSLAGLDQRQLMQLLQFMNPSPGNNDASLQRIFSGTDNESSPAPDSQNNSAFAQADAISTQLQELLRSGSAIEKKRPRRAELDFADVVTGERVLETVRNNNERLASHIPPEFTNNASQETVATIHSPQFRQASTSFGHALQTGQMAPVLDQFGIPADAKEAAQRGDLLEFAKKLTEAEQKDGQKTEATNLDDSIREPEPKRGKPDDEMELD